MKTLLKALRLLVDQQLSEHKDLTDDEAKQVVFGDEDMAEKLIMDFYELVRNKSIEGNVIDALVSELRGAQNDVIAAYIEWRGRYD